VGVNFVWLILAGSAGWSLCRSRFAAGTQKPVNSVVLTDVTAGATAVGSPAKVLTHRKRDEFQSSLFGSGFAIAFRCKDANRFAERIEFKSVQPFTSHI
jgi:hypothetical protein